MTFPHRETKTDRQTWENTKTIEQGLKAARQQNWLLVTRYLQQLPLNNQQPTSIKLAPTIWEKGFQLALSVLFYGDFQQRWEIAKIIPRLGKKVIHPLIALLEDEEVDIEVRWFISRILGQFNEPAIVIALVKLLQQTEQEELALVAAQTLANIGTAAVDALSKLLVEEEYRLLSVRALAHIRSVETINPLLTVVDDPQPEIRAVAIETLGSFRDERIIPILLQALKDTEAKVRKEAVIALGFRLDIATKLNLVEKIEPLLYDLNLEVCCQAAISLGRIGNEQSMNALFKVLKSPLTPLNLKLGIVRALSWKSSELALNYLQQALLIEEEEICQEIIAVLGRLTENKLKARATHILVDFWHSAKGKISKPILKQNLAMAFSILGQKEAIVSLRQLSEDSEESVRLHAIAALRKLEIKN
ncbi:MAG: HEAT repeat domain-containing protein [Xenococcaceae cyanobacterium MO_188.B32]|nr:HEAT repeat domain-containing protein [Xenococcaceae cyanobacterium MO_188.B32]